MIFQFFFCLFCFSWVCFTSPLVAQPLDSAKTMQRNGKTFLLYKVQTGETLRKIAQIHHTTVRKIVVENAGLDSNKVKAGQLLYVPLVLPTSPLVATYQHTIQKGENLTKIAALYQISIDSLVFWNNLANQPLQIGQVLVIGGNGSKQGIVTENMLSKIDKKKGKHEIGKGEKIQSRGEAKFVLHRTAHIGSSILLINPTNHFAVKAKVIGKIPNIDLNKEILVKLSTATCEALGIVNDQFAIEVVYEKK